MACSTDASAPAADKWYSGGVAPETKTEYQEQRYASQDDGAEDGYA
jgi:hypothetical protein